MYVGLTLTYASQFQVCLSALPVCRPAAPSPSPFSALTQPFRRPHAQMLRGSVVIFTGLMSKFWLKRKLEAFHWVGKRVHAYCGGCPQASAVHCRLQPVGSAQP